MYERVLLVEQKVNKSELTELKERDTSCLNDKRLKR